MIKKLIQRFFLKDKILYLFKVNENNIVLNHIVFNERSCGKNANKWIDDQLKETGEKWIVSELPIGGQYYPEYGSSFTGEVKPIFKKEYLWKMNEDPNYRTWVPIIDMPNDGKKYQFCEDCERWVEKKCC